MPKSPGNFFSRLALPETPGRRKLSPDRRFLRGVPVFWVLLLFLCVPVQREYPVSLPLAGFSKVPAFSVLSGAGHDNPLIGIRRSVFSDSCFHPVDFSGRDSPDVLTCSHDTLPIQMGAGQSFSVLVPDLPEGIVLHRRLFPPGAVPDDSSVFSPRSSPPPKILPA